MEDGLFVPDVVWGFIVRSLVWAVLFDSLSLCERVVYGSFGLSLLFVS